MGNENYGFRVKHVPDSYDSLWEVSLPHQCDRWEVTSGTVPHEVAVRQLEQFIAEAQNALEHLRDERALNY